MNNTTKQCANCGKTKSKVDFTVDKGRNDGRYPYCKKCKSEKASENQKGLNAYHKNYRKTDKYKKWYAEYLEETKEKRKQLLVEYRDKQKRDAFNAYGGAKCSCCGESELDFLAIDHINGGGTKHRKELKGGGTQVYVWLKKNNYPEDFRVLCHNCNWGMYKNNGICPHQQ